ncbi:MAG: hypothetical protein FH749_11350 [Firmicutes bacterium]|nr:hypothetical protein [Bacillota bacterium]
MSRLCTVPLERIRELQTQFDGYEFSGLKQMLANLPHVQRNVLLLHVHYGYSYNEIAKLTQSSLESVRGRIYRARQVLKKEFCK